MNRYDLSFYFGVAWVGMNNLFILGSEMAIKEAQEKSNREREERRRKILRSRQVVEGEAKLMSS